MNTPNKTSSAAQKSASKGMSQNAMSVMKSSHMKSSVGFSDTTFASPSKMKSTGGNYKTPSRGTMSNNKKGGPLDSNADFGNINDSLLKSSM